jgi:hypothetical protein
VNRTWIAVAIVAVAACSGQQAVAPAPSSTSLADYGVPPPGVALFYVRDPDNSDWYVGIDWTGKPRGTVKLAQPLDAGRTIIQAPDGSGFVIEPFKGLGGKYLDRLARPVAGFELPGGMQFAWADDSQHLCSLDYSSRQWHVGLMAPGKPPTSHVVAIDPFVVQSGVIAIRVAACSPQNDSAVLTYSYAEYPTGAWVVRISDGTIVRREFKDRNLLSNIVPSADGSLIAENSNRSTGYLMEGAATQTSIRRVSDGSVVTDLDASYGVLAFSSDNKVALVTTTPWVAGVKTNVGLVDLRTGTLFSRMESGELAGFRLQPGAKAFALFWKDVGDQSLHPRIDVYLIGTSRSDGFLPRPYLEP